MIRVGRREQLVDVVTIDIYEPFLWCGEVGFPLMFLDESVEVLMFKDGAPRPYRRQLPEATPIERLGKDDVTFNIKVR
jgi:hypothetical protein